MSVIAARVFDGFVEMSSDSIMVRGDMIILSETTAHTKMMKFDNGLIIGATGRCEETSLFYRFVQMHNPETATTKDVLAFILEFLQWKQSYVTGEIQNEYLIAFKGKLFWVERMFVDEVKDYAAIGAGMNYATAALYLGADTKKAVKTACDLCCYVAEPIQTLTSHANE